MANLLPFRFRTSENIRCSILIAALLLSLTQNIWLYNETLRLEDELTTLKEDFYMKERGHDKINQELKLCKRDIDRILDSLAQIFFITPTYNRPTQKADLTRLAQTLASIPKLFWIIVEDSDEPSTLVSGVATQYSITNVMLSVQTPQKYKLNETDPTWLKPKGVLQRNLALNWLRNNMASINGVVYFGDDDNTYDWRLFDEIRSVKRVGIWPVGLAGGLMVERPLVDGKTQQVTGWVSGWKIHRPFPIDMAGFAINLKLVLQYPKASFTYEVARGYQESHFLQEMKISLDQLEPKAQLCTKVYVWHTKTQKAKLDAERKLIKINRTRSNINIEV